MLDPTAAYRTAQVVSASRAGQTAPRRFLEAWQELAARPASSLTGARR